MKRFLWWCQKEPVVMGVLIVCILCVSLLPDLIKWRQTPAGHAYQPIHNNLIDYAVYTNFIKQGMDHAPLLLNRFTTEPQSGTFPLVFFLGLGFLGKMTGISDPGMLYLGNRIVLAVLFALTSYWFIGQYIKGKAQRLTALFLILFSGSIPVVVWSQGTFTVSSHLSWWSGIDPVIRATFLPHHLAGNICMLLTIGLLTHIRSHPHTRSRIVLALLTGFFAGLIHPPSLMVPVLIFPPWCILTKQWKTLGMVLCMIPLWSISIAVVAIQFSLFPWTQINEYQRLMFAIPVWEYCLALGPILFLGAIGAILKRKAPITLLWILWSILPILAIPISRMISESPIPFVRLFTVSNVRFLQMAPVIPLSILSTAALHWISVHFGKLKAYGFFGVLLIITFLPYPLSVIRESSRLFGGRAYQYPTKGWMDAVASLHGKSGAVLSLPFAGCAIAGTSNRTVYVARDVYTLNLVPKTDLAFQFFQGTMPLCRAYSLLADNGITDIFSGYDEQTAAGDLSKYPFLRLEKDFGDTQIFESTGQKPEECK